MVPRTVCSSSFVTAIRSPIQWLFRIRLMLFAAAGVVDAQSAEVMPPLPPVVIITPPITISFGPSGLTTATSHTFLAEEGREPNALARVEEGLF
jgi:hypothetical protein